MGSSKLEDKLDKHTWIPIGIRYETLRFSSLAVDSGGEIVAASAKGALVFWDRGGYGK